MKEKNNPTSLPGHTEGFTHIIFDGKPEKITFESVDFKRISLWRQNVRASKEVTLDLCQNKDDFIQELSNYPQLKTNAERLLKSILEYGVKDHIYCKESKNSLLIAYEGNSRSIALRLAYFKNPNLFSRIPVAIVPSHVSERAVLDYVRHLHMDRSASMVNWDRLNKARDWERTLNREGNKALSKLAKSANQEAEAEDAEAENITPKSVLNEVEAYRLFKLRAEKRGMTHEAFQNDPRSGSFSNHVSLVSKSKKLKGLFNKDSQTFKKADLILELGTKSDTTGLSPQVLRRRADYLPKLSLKQIKEAAEEKTLGRLFENEKKKRAKRSISSQNTRLRVTFLNNLIKAKTLIDEAIQQLRKSNLPVHKINQGRDFLKNITAIINSFLKK